MGDLGFSIQTSARVSGRRVGEIRAAGTESGENKEAAYGLVEWVGDRKQKKVGVFRMRGWEEALNHFGRIGQLIISHFFSLNDGGA